MGKYYYTHEQFIADMKTFYNRVDKKELSMIDSIVALSRGGLVIAQYLGYMYGIRDIITVPVIGYDETTDSGERDVLHVKEINKMVKDKNILIVDDLIDSGNSILAVLENITWMKSFQIFTIFANEGKAHFALRKKPDAWIVLPWDSEIEEITGEPNG